MSRRPSFFVACVAVALAIVCRAPDARQKASQGPLGAGLQESGFRLQFAGKPKMLDCDGTPCFRMDVNAVDQQGRPAPVTDAAPFTVTESGHPLRIILQRALNSAPKSGIGGGAPPRVTLVLFDTSGSMGEALATGESKFAMARRQIEQLFTGFRDGLDEMAIAPFDSQRVAQRIREARFHSTREALKKNIASLRINRQGNTALFSATEEALQVLSTRTRTNAQVSLVVFTDGMNDVGHPSDDPGLAAGAVGLQRVAQLAAAVGVAVYTVGYGAPGVAFDESAMRALAYPANAGNYFSANDEKRLLEVFSSIEARSALVVRLLAEYSGTRREQFQGRPLVFRVEAGPGGASGESPAWEGAPLGTPPWEGTLDSAEADALLQHPLDNGGSAGEFGYLVRMLVLVAYGLLLALFWFVVPRFIWPESYIPKPVIRSAAPPSRPPPPPAARRPPSPRGSGDDGRATLRPRGGSPGRTVPSSPRDTLGQGPGSNQTVYIPPPKRGES